MIIHVIFDLRGNDLENQVTKGALIYAMHFKISILAYKHCDSKRILDNLLQRAEKISGRIKDSKHHAQLLRESVKEYELQQKAEKKAREKGLEDLLSKH